jgi:hypothetical protein
VRADEEFITLEEGRFITLGEGRFITLGEGRFIMLEVARRHGIREAYCLNQNMTTKYDW